jgi:pimeloyl-ACP methyl ester carboxylesterase
MWPSVLVVLVLLVAGAATAGRPLGLAGTKKHCKAGSVAGTIAGKHVCLKAGARCTKRLDRAYHRYRFHCHSGRLTRFPAPAPPPPAPTPSPPTLAEPPAPGGGLIDVGGYRLHLECVGTGAPTIVFEPGNTASRHGARRVQYALSTESRVCTYDRPGTVSPIAGSSDPRPANVPPTSETFVRELHTVLTNANVPGPYLLVGASFGGLLISAYTAHYPAEVAGLVFIDAVGPAAAETIGNVIIEPWEPGADLDLIRGVTFGSRPVVILTTTLANEAADIRRRSANVVEAGAPQYGHFVLLETPGLAYEAIRVATAAVRAGGALPACAQTRLPRVGARCTTS